MTRRGFTLVELAVVLLILGIAAAVSVPAYTAFFRRDAVSAGAAEVQQFLRGAREMAIGNGRPVTAVLVPLTGRYEIYGSGGLAVDSVRTGTLALPEGIRVTPGTAARYVFSPTGGGTGPVLTVSGGGSAAVRVRVDRWTGEARVDR